MPEKMVGFKCKKCGKIMYPKHARCTGCRSTDFEEVPLGEECTLVTYTKLYAVPLGVDQVPLALVGGTQKDRRKEDLRIQVRTKRIHLTSQRPKRNVVSMACVKAFSFNNAVLLRLND